MNMFSLDGKTALVTGASRGLGRAMAEEAEDEAGAIDILANNAGTIRRHPAAEFPADDWDHVVQINQDAVFLLCQRFGRKMVERGHGKIINTASLLSFTGGITVPAYTASKHAVAGLTKAFANEWAGSGVQVNAIAPGYFRTDNTQPLQDNPEREEAIRIRIPAGRWGEPQDLGGAAVFHLMGEPEETRSLVVRDGEAVLSPGWFIHAGAGTSRYTFCWAVGGENQDFGDMQGVDVADMK